MILKKNSSEYVNLKIIESRPTYYQAVELLEKTSGEYASIDRGFASDYYECELTIDGKRDEILSIDNFINSILETGDDPFISSTPYITDLNDGERPFGDNISYEGLTCFITIIEKGDVVQTNLNRYTLRFTIRTTSADLYFKGSTDFPKIENITHNISRTNTPQFFNFDTYEGSQFNYFTTQRNNECVIDSIMDVESAIDLQEWFRNQRKQPFTMRKDDFGMEYPFGDQYEWGDYNGSNYYFRAIMTNLDVQYISPSHRAVSMDITMITQETI